MTVTILSFVSALAPHPEQNAARKVFSCKPLHSFKEIRNSAGFFKQQSFNPAQIVQHALPETGTSGTSMSDTGALQRNPAPHR
ncbi:hypothetical protein [Pseudochrobactrum sp. AO18b]|uniref:hypothetical protein n=1 Tax=Pseudochrobactrum sp. AO18b TaxID=1201036 RepID=UPI0012EC84D4|nr:hypothetical protein [Pseudochrobactrum sp. AO18b]